MEKLQYQIKKCLNLTRKVILNIGLFNYILLHFNISIVNGCYGFKKTTLLGFFFLISFKINFEN